METELNAANLPNNIGSKPSYNSVPLFRELFYNLICSRAGNRTHNAKFQNFQVGRKRAELTRNPLTALTESIEEFRKSKIVLHDGGNS